jgi:hypothetical protein
MQDLKPEETKRECVRATLGAEVQFAVLDADEYKGRKYETGSRRRWLFDQPVKPPTFREEEVHSTDSAFYLNLIQYLVNIEDKLDRVLKVLYKDEMLDAGLFLGEGLDISGGGMRILCHEKLMPGQVLNMTFRIFRYPVMSLEVYGKVCRVTPVDRQRYEVGVEFLDLDEQYREWIISYVFQMQREAIRSRKKV